jgi:SAM-dependent methyltransferase
MNILRRLTFDLWYLQRPPWESGIVPPEVNAFLAAHPPGRALDLGCGSGTSSLALARAGWSVTGVDFAPRAVRIARSKAARAGKKVDFRVADVTHLPPLPAPFDLILDIGCFHGLGMAQKTTYLAQLERLLAPGGTWLLYAFFKPEGAGGPGLVASDLEQAVQTLKLAQREDGVDRKNRPSAWFWFGRK